MKLVHIACPHQYPDHQEGTDALGNDGRQSSSSNSHMEIDNEYNIQNNISKAAGDQEI